MARNFFRLFTENNPVMWDSKTFCIPEAKGLTPFITGPYVGYILDAVHACYMYILCVVRVWYVCVVCMWCQHFMARSAGLTEWKVNCDVSRKIAIQIFNLFLNWESALSIQYVCLTNCSLFHYWQIAQWNTTRAGCNISGDWSGIYAWDYQLYYYTCTCSYLQCMHVGFFHSQMYILCMHGIICRHFVGVFMLCLQWHN